MNDEYTVWRRPRSQGRTYLNDAMNEVMRKEAEKISIKLDNDIIGQITEMKRPQVRAIKGTLTGIDFWNETSLVETFKINRRKVFINGNTYNINRKTLIL